ncbi:MAG: DNA cytosine methyltransferase [Lachnospiraceae bacterium]|jgi:site-specific DNA-cytosine methylase
MVKILLGGSPCTFWSICQSKNRETKAEGIGWELFLNYVIAKEKFKPDFFLYENNWSASKEIKEQIQEELGCKLMRINSRLVSAQNRDRFYVFNWDVDQPEDRGIYVRDIIDFSHSDTNLIDFVSFNGVDDSKVKEKSVRIGTIGNGGQGERVYSINGKSVTFSACGGGRGSKGRLYLIDGCVRKLSVLEAERLQTLPDGYCLNKVSDAQAKKAIGNGWTAEVIIHILQGALKDIPKDEKIVVLSMYDGIGTGRYCLNKMGFTNVEYHAYEIDKYAMKIAMSNYPDIIQHGDAFQLREEGWAL